MSALTANDEVDILVLGAGWTSQFLVPLLNSENVSYALTTTHGSIKDCCRDVYSSDKIVAFEYDPDSPGECGISKLPTAHTVIITFPLKGKGPTRKLVEAYKQTHSGHQLYNWVQLGSTGIYQGPGFHNHESDITQNPRSEAEDELLDLGGTVLNLAGLWGGGRNPANWVPKVASSKEKLKEKTSLHLIHGEDVARALLAVHRKFYAGRWIVTDQRVYDWWDLIYGWADDLESTGKDGQPLEYKKWILELMKEEGINFLPRDRGQLGRHLHSSKFWEMLDVQPKKTVTNKIDSLR